VFVSCARTDVGAAARAATIKQSRLILSVDLIIVFPFWFNRLAVRTIKELP
jgi:hypothetical protein